MSVATTYASVSQRTNVYAEVKMLEYAEPILVLEKFADVKPLPKNKAETISFRRPIPFNVEPTELVEGVTPPATQMAYEDVEVRMGQYGSVVEISDRVNDLVEDPVLNDAARMAGEQAAETKERICWGAFRAGTNVTYSPTTASARSGVQEKINLNIQRAITRSLHEQRGKYITEVLSSSPNFATEAVRQGFVAVGHTDLEADIRQLAGFVPCESYGEQTKILHEMELGKVENVRYVLSPVLEPFAGAGGSGGTNVLETGGNADVYPVLFMARHAIGVVPLKGAGSMSPRIINPEQIDKSDPLGQRGIVGWKMYFAALILNEAWINRAEVAATDLLA